MAGTTVRAMRMQRELETGAGNDTQQEIVRTLIALEPYKERRLQEGQEQLRRERLAREARDREEANVREGEGWPATSQLNDCHPNVTRFRRRMWVQGGAYPRR